MRDNSGETEQLDPFSFVGHEALEMTLLVNRILDTDPDVRCKQVIISGGINSFLDGYYLINLSRARAVYGQASNFLLHARGDYKSLQQYIRQQVEGLKLANAYLKIKDIQD